MANFELSEQAKKEQDDAQKQQNEMQLERINRGIGNGNIAGSVATPEEMMRYNALEQQKVAAQTNDQARRGGVEVADATANAGGIAGFFGGKETTQHFTAGQTQDNTTAGNKAMLAAQIAEMNGRPIARMDNTASMQAATAAGPDLSGSNDWRSQQAALAGQLANAAAGNGPSAAQSQLQAATDQNMHAALALARSGTGNQSAAMKQALMQQGTIGQQAANQSATLRAQEQQAAQAQLGGVLGGARGQDLGATGLQQNATLANAGFQQAANTTNAGFMQDTAKTNLAAHIQQQQQKDEMIQRYITQGMTLDQAQHAAEIQQAQFNAQLLSNQAAADKGVAMQSSNAAGQGLGQAAGAIAGTIAALA